MNTSLNRFIYSLLFMIFLFLYSNAQSKNTNKNKEIIILKQPSTVSDIDGNVYRTVSIGTQVWMAENLKVTKYRNGAALPNIVRFNEWMRFESGAYCYTNKNFDNSDGFGCLYNWAAVNDSRNIAPTGWRVPTKEDWEKLEIYLKKTWLNGGALKAAHNSWKTPNSGATNSTGFTAYPGGMRNIGGEFMDVYEKGFWWSCTESSSTDAWYFRLSYLENETSLLPYLPKKSGFSIRCIKN